MADVYGFDDSKSKVQIVDKASQSTKDAEQDEDIANVQSMADNKAISDIVATVDGDNLAVTVKQADGTSKGGSVTLPAGGEIEIEQYGNIVNEDTLKMTFAPTGTAVSVNITSSSSKRYYIFKSGTYDGEGLYYDTSNNVIKRCVSGNPTAVSSGTLSMRYYGSQTSYNSANLLHAFLYEKLVGLEAVNIYGGTSINGGEVAFRVASNRMILVTVTGDTTSPGTITGISKIQFLSTSAEAFVMSAGEYTLELAYYSSSTTYPLIPVISKGDMPSTYTKIIDL